MTACVCLDCPNRYQDRHGRCTVCGSESVLRLGAQHVMRAALAAKRPERRSGLLRWLRKGAA